MEKILFYEKEFLDEKGEKFRLAYWLLIHSAKRERAYGVAVEKSNAAGTCERDAFCGLSRERADVEKFLRKLCRTTALPVELAALCDDFISEQENAGERERELAVS